MEDLADREAPLRLKSFEEGFASRVDSLTGNAEKDIDAAMAQLDKDNGWKSDKAIKPNLVDHKWMTSIRETTEKVTAALPESDPKRKEIQAKFDALVAKDKENRQIRKERTFMTPDRYTGGDIGELKKKAEELVKNNKKEGGEPLRCTIISENWQEQTVEEWTDTTKTTWRRRTTRSITAQVAAKTVTAFGLSPWPWPRTNKAMGTGAPCTGTCTNTPTPCWSQTSTNRNLKDAKQPWTVMFWGIKFLKT